MAQTHFEADLRSLHGEDVEFRVEGPLYAGRPTASTSLKPPNMGLRFGLWLAIWAVCLFGALVALVTTYIVFCAVYAFFGLIAATVCAAAIFAALACTFFANLAGR